jgi:hypothetical protein
MISHAGTAGGNGLAGEGLPVGGLNNPGYIPIGFPQVFFGGGGLGAGDFSGYSAGSTGYAGYVLLTY